MNYQKNGENGEAADADCWPYSGAGGAGPAQYMLTLRCSLKQRVVSEAEVMTGMIIAMWSAGREEPVAAQTILGPLH